MRTRSLALTLALMAALALAGCAKSSDSKTQPTTPPVTRPSTPAPATPTPGSSTPGTGTPTTSTPGTTSPTTPTPGVPSSLNEQVPFADAGKVRAAIAAPSPVNYQVINLGAVTGDKEQYFDELLAKSALPGANDMVLVIFSADHNDIRFALGSLFNQKGVKVDEILTLVRENYLPQARAGRPEDGIVALVGAVNARMK